MVVGARLAGISETAHLLGFSHTIISKVEKKVSGSSLAENASLMWPDCFELIRREQQLK